MLCFVYVLNFLDRQLLAILAKPIQDDLGVTDGQIGLISGLYFALFYCLLAIPVGWLADRSNRVRVLSFACLLWSAATVACGFAPAIRSWPPRAWRSASARPAACRPRTRSSATTFRPACAARALSLFNLGPPIGQALGIAFGASITAAYSWRRRSWPWERAASSPRSLVWAFVREPVRGGLDDQPRRRHGPSRRKRRSGRRAARSSPTRAAARVAGVRRDAVRHLRRPQLHALFLMREKGMTLAELAVYYALVMGIAICAGCTPRAADRSLRAAVEARLCLSAGRGLALAIPFHVAFVWAPRWPLALAVPGRADVLQLLLPVAARSRWSRSRCRPTSASSPARCCCS
jgi:MFS family permease